MFKDRMPYRSRRVAYRSRICRRNKRLASGSAPKLCGCHHKWKSLLVLAAAVIWPTMRSDWKRSCQAPRTGRKNRLAGTSIMPSTSRLPPTGKKLSASRTAALRQGLLGFGTGAIEPDARIATKRDQSALARDEKTIAADLVAREDDALQRHAIARRHRLGSIQVGCEGFPSATLLQAIEVRERVRSDLLPVVLLDLLHQ